jgi:hypothetical protein
MLAAAVATLTELPQFIRVRKASQPSSSFWNSNVNTLLATECLYTGQALVSVLPEHVVEMWGNAMNLRESIFTLRKYIILVDFHC